MTRRLAIALVHYPVLDGKGEVVTTAITNLDVHDLRTERAHLRRQRLLPRSSHRRPAPAS